MRRHTYHRGGNSFADVSVYESQRELALAYQDAEEYWQRDKRDKWYGGSAPQTLGACLTGSRDYAQRIEAMSKKITPPDIKVKRKVKKRGAFGPIVNVSEALKGNPACYVRKAKVRDNMAPLTIVYDVTVSAGIDTTTMVRRGAAVMNVVKQLSSIRPVELYVVTGMLAGGKTHLMAVKLDTEPLDVARTGWALCSPAMLRQIGFTMTYQNAKQRPNGMIRWSFNDNKWQNKKLAAAMSPYVGYKESEYLYLTGRHVSSGDFSSDADAIKWTEETIATYSPTKEV